MLAHKGTATANTCLKYKLYLPSEQNMEHAILVDWVMNIAQVNHQLSCKAMKVKNKAFNKKTNISTS